MDQVKKGWAIVKTKFQNLETLTRNLKAGTNHKHIIKAAIVSQDFPKKYLNAEEGELIRNYILKKLAHGYHKQFHPHFNTCEFSGEGALIITFPDKDTLTWLKFVIVAWNHLQSDPFDESPENSVTAQMVPDQPDPDDDDHYLNIPHLKVIDFELFPQYTTLVSVQLPAPESVDSILQKLVIQNRGLQTDSWRMLHIENDTNGQHVTFMIEEPSLKLLEKSNFSLYYSFSSVIFKIVGKLKRDEIGGLVNDEKIKMEEQISCPEQEERKEDTQEHSKTAKQNKISDVIPEQEISDDDTVLYHVDCEFDENQSAESGL